MSNFYWPVYLNLEAELNKLTFSIHIDDEQLDVYSSKITDLILRSAVEIESISKALYILNGGTKTGNFKYDDVAIKYINQLWKLDCKKVIVSSPHCFQTERVLVPFIKNVVRSSSKTNKMTYSWNNAYQNLKHDRSEFFSYGSLRHLFEILSALYILNLYYRNESIPLDKDSKGIGFDLGQGSSIFSIKLEPLTGHDGAGKYRKGEGFDECLYYVDWTEKSGSLYQSSWSDFDARFKELVIAHPKVLEYVNQNIANLKDFKGNLGHQALGQDLYIQLMQQAQREKPIKTDQLEYEALINKNDI